MGVRLAALRGARWVLWLVVGWILLRGIVSIVAPPPVPEPVVAPVSALAEPAVVDQAPGAFAALFAREYLALEAGKEKERAARLAGLMARSLDPQAGWSANSGAGTGSQSVDATWAFRVEPLTPSRWLVTVAARVTAVAPAEPAAEAGTVAVAADGAQKAPAVRTVYLAVPVQGGPEGYAVYDYPSFVPGPAPADVTGPVVEGSDLPDTGGEIRTLLTNFFKAYAAGGQSEMGYYLEPGLKWRGLEGAMTFTGLHELTIRQADNGETWAAALVGLDDPVTSFHVRQRFTLQLVQRDGRWYIKQILQKGV